VTGVQTPAVTTKIPARLDRVVVGVQGAAGSRAAISLAAREARRRGAELIAVMACSSERALGAPAGRPVATLRTADGGRAG
jgi:nucleotide-binding universal stress UspA family protein